MLYFVSFFFGMLFGNFATSFIHRIPLGKPLRGIGRRVNNNSNNQTLPPHCASCKVRLKPLEYLPIIGFLKTLGKCKYCGVKIPIIYPFTEVFCGLLGVLVLQIMGMNYLFISTLLLLVIVYSTFTICVLKCFKIKKEDENA